MTWNNQQPRTDKHTEIREDQLVDVYRGATDFVISSLNELWIMRNSIHIKPASIMGIMDISSGGEECGTLPVRRDSPIPLATGSRHSIFDPGFESGWMSNPLA